MRNILITGASSGIGRALALERAAAGDQVWATVRKIADAAELVEASGGRIRPLLLDVRDHEAIQGLAETLGAATGEAGLQALVNNAGVVVAGPLEEIALDAFRQQLEVNLVAPLALAQALLPALRLGNGRIIQVGSISGQLTVPFLGPYSVAKTGLAVLSRALRMELAPWRIPVVLVVLGNYRTPLWSKVLGDGAVNGGAYGVYMAHARRIGVQQAKAASEVSTAVRALARAIEAKRPKAVYRVAWVPHLLEALRRLLPEPMLDGVLRRFYGLDQPAGRNPWQETSEFRNAHAAGSAEATPLPNLNVPRTS